MSPSSSRFTRSLAVLFAIQTVGFLGLVWRQGTPLGSALGLLGLSSDAAMGIDRMGAVLVAVAAVGLLSGRRAWIVAGGVWAAVWMLASSLVDALYGGHVGAGLAPAAHAVRWATPAAAAALGGGVALASGRTALTWAAGAVFVAHGIECLLGHPTFVAFLTTIPERVVGMIIDPPSAVTLLMFIGLLDIGVGVAMVVVGGGGTVALWMVFWGFLTALVRILYFGEAGWPDAMVRVTNGGVPLVLAWSRRWSVFDS